VKVMHERVAGIDVHKEMVKVAIRSPGEKRRARKTGVLAFGTFYGVLGEMARELRRRGVRHVAMEASGGCTEPVYDALMAEDFDEVLAVNPAHVKAVKGQKAGAKDCARIAELLECGLLQGWYLPPPELTEMRDLTRRPGPRRRWPACRWRWKAGSPATTRRCAGSSSTRSPP
jgi:transposase